MKPSSVAAFLLLLLLAPGLKAQLPPGWDASEFQMKRAQLEELLARYESVATSPGYSGSVKDDARRSADLIRTRLEEGDFKVGDRIVLRVEGATAGVIPDTLVVGEGPSIAIPGMERMSLRGVLRSELQDFLEAEIGRYLRNPTLAARSLIRLSIQGAVGQPGFYVFPSEMLLSDVLMQAGGPASNADLDEIEVRRGSTDLMEGKEMRTALDEGRSLDQLGLQAGDEITIPERPSQSWWPQVLRYGVLVTTTLLLGVRIF